MIHCSQCPGYNSKLLNSPFLKEKTVNGDYHTTISKLLHPCLKKKHFNEQKNRIDTIKKNQMKILKLKKISKTENTILENATHSY